MKIYMKNIQIKNVIIMMIILIILLLMLLLSSCRTSETAVQENINNNTQDNQIQSNESISTISSETEQVKRVVDEKITVKQVYDESKVYASSTQLQVSWQGADDIAIPEKYKIIYFDNTTNQEQIVETKKTTMILSSLKAGTEYYVMVEACTVDVCTTVGSNKQATEEEYWQVQGTGNDYTTVTQIVEKGNVLAQVLLYGSWAPSDLQGKILLYYKPMIREGGVALAMGTDEKKFEKLSNYKLQDPCKVSTKMVPTNINQIEIEGSDLDCFGPWYITSIKATESVPLASGNVRLFFESSGTDDATRILYLDSADGYRGMDFNSGTGTTCVSKEDWNTGCVPQVAIGIDDDEENGNSGLKQVRQFKVGYPKQKSWVWDESKGTFMVITGGDICSKTGDGLFYAVWDGNDWVVQKDETNCSRVLVPDAHGPVLVDLSTTKYKLYYQEQSKWLKDHKTPKPFQMLYADATLTGDPTLVDVDDWEAANTAREVHYIWPNGEIVSDETEPGFGDNFIYYPTNDPKYQLMYMNLGGPDDLTWRKSSYGFGMAILVNP